MKGNLMNIGYDFFKNPVKFDRIRCRAGKSGGILQGENGGNL